MNLDLYYYNMNLDLLTPGELAAYKQGKQIVSLEQLAASYLVAKYNLIGLSPNFKIKLTNDIAIECGMSIETFRRNVEKFKLILQDKHEDENETYKECVYSKIINAYTHFLELPEDKVFELAEKSFTEDNKKIGLAIQLENEKHKQQSAKEFKILDNKIKTNVISLYNTLNKIFNNPSKSKKQAITKISKELDVSEDRIIRIWNTIDALKHIK